MIETFVKWAFFAGFVIFLVWGAKKDSPEWGSFEHNVTHIVTFLCIAWFSICAIGYAQCQIDEGCRNAPRAPVELRYSR